MDITTDELGSLLRRNDRIFLRLPIVRNGTFIIEKTIAFLKELENAVNDIDIIVYSKFQLTHLRVPESPKYAKSVLCEAAIKKSHPDVLPYTELIVSLPKTVPSEIVKSAAAMHEVEAIMFNDIDAIEK
ncbi:MAG: hypothetical protein HYT72_04455 [Candidatus Aenigmarchaeota archaeon]|nr:hypothetical protein [Candidatus Aenigmarchaeota archaeon]